MFRRYLITRAWLALTPAADAAAGASGTVAAGGAGAAAAGAGAGTGAAAAGESGAAGTAAAAAGTTAQSSEGAAAAAASAAPESYTLTLPDGATDAALLERTALIAKERGLSNEQAQALVNFAHQEGTTRADTAAKAAVDAAMKSYAPGGEKWLEQVETWKTQTLADPALGKTPEERSAAIQSGHGILMKYGEANPADADAMKGFLNTSGLGNHPAAVRFFAWLGKAAGEGSLVTGAGKATAELTEQDRLDRMYPSMAKKKD